MKILHVFKTYYSDGYGGVELIIHNLAKGARRYGHTAEVFTVAPRNSAGTGMDVEVDYRVHRARRFGRAFSTDLSFDAFGRFRKLVREFDLVHYHFPWPLMDLLHFYARPRIPSLVTYQSDVVKQKLLYKFYRPVQNRFLGAMDAIVASSRNYLETSQVLVRFPETTRVIPLGIEARTESADAARVAHWRECFGDAFFLFLGALRYYKGLRYLLRAARECRAKIVIAGGGTEEETLKRECRELGVENVFFLGRVSEVDKWALLEACYAFVFPSHLRSEAFGLAIAEALMVGKPVVSCEIGTGTSFVNLGNVTGLTVPPENPAALAAAMSTLLDNPSLAREMGGQAKKRFSEYFDCEIMTAQYVDLYEELLRKGIRRGK